MTTKTKGNKPVARAGSSKNQSSRTTPILLIAFGLIAVALIAAIVFSGEEPIGSGDEYGDPTVSGESLPAFGDAPSLAADPAAGTAAPEVTGQDFDGSTVSIGGEGTPAVVIFLAHWCSHCQAEVPVVQSWLDSGGGVEGVDIVSVTTSASSGAQNWPPSEWLQREGWSSPNIRDDQANSVLNAYGGSSFPYWVFLDGDGNVALRLAGEIDIATLELAMNGLVDAG